MGKRFSSQRNDAGSLLAAVFIIALGAGCCLFTVAAMSPQSVPMAAVVIAGTAGFFLFLVILLRLGKGSGGGMSFLSASQKNRRDDGAGDYEPRRANNLQPITGGTNQPISAEQAREIRITSPNTWVPAPARRKRKK